MSIPKYLGVGLMTHNATGDFCYAAAVNPLWQFLNFSEPLRSECQQCRHPEAHLFTHAPLSILELRSTRDCLASFKGYLFKYTVIHWNATLAGDKVATWEQYFLNARHDTMAEAVECFDQQRAIWKEHGYFTLEQWEERQAKLRALDSSIRIRKALRRDPAASPAPKDDPLFLPTLQLLEDAFPQLSKYTHRKDEQRKIECFEFESKYPSGKVDPVDYQILRMHRKAMVNKTRPPLDREVADEIKRAIPGLVITPHAVKLRRQSLGIHGGERGPQPTP